MRYRDVPVERPLIWVVPGERPASAPENVIQRRGYTVRTRGDRTGTVLHDYDCPEHGRFSAHVPRADVPDTIGCNHEGCDERATWAGSMCGIGISAGEVTC